MRNVTVSMLVVAMLAAGICIFSARTVSAACAEMEKLRLEAQALCEQAQKARTISCVQDMQQLWERKKQVLSAVLSHSAVDEVTSVLIEADADLLAGEADEFIGDMELLGELLRRLEKDEQLHLSNILTIC